MSNTVDHVCVADHCVACCPTAQGYNAGFNDAKSFYSSLDRMRLLDGPSPEAIFLLCLLIVTAIIGLKIIAMLRERDASESVA